MVSVHTSVPKSGELTDLSSKVTTAQGSSSAKAELSRVIGQEMIMLLVSGRK